MSVYISGVSYGTGQWAMPPLINKGKNKERKKEREKREKKERRRVRIQRLKTRDTRKKNMYMYTGLWYSILMFEFFFHRFWDINSRHGSRCSFRLEILKVTTFYHEDLCKLLRYLNKDYVDYSESVISGNMVQARNEKDEGHEGESSPYSEYIFLFSFTQSAEKSSKWTFSRALWALDFPSLT